MIIDPNPDDLLKKAEQKEQELIDYLARPPHELLQDAANAIIKSGENPLYFGYEKIDNELEGDLRGQLCGFIGRGGTRKSLAAMNLLNLNAGNIDDKISGIYSNMEMSINSLLNRLMDYAVPSMVDPVRGVSVNSSRYFKNCLKVFEQERKRIINDLTDILKGFYGDRLLINSKSNMSSDDYRRLIDVNAKKYGKLCDLLIVDGNSMMGGDGNETDRYSKNSKELKEIANDYDIFVGNIYHTTKGCEYHTRDLRPYVRGSEKILDNCDMFFMTSLCINPQNTDEYLEDLGYIRFINKRGSGKTINQIYRFDKSRLKLEDSSIEPESVEIEKDKNKYNF